MSEDLRIEGADAFLALSKHLKATGRTELRKELNRGLRTAAKPLIAVARKGALDTLPRRGGLAARTARKPMRVAVKTGKNPGVSVGVSKADPRIDAGRLFHPVFGRRPGVVQSVRPGWFSESLQGEADHIRDDVIDVLQNVADKIAKG